MPKQLNVSLNFSADTSQAKAQIQSLIAELNKIGSTSQTSFTTDALTHDLLEAKMAAKEFGTILDNAFNADVGRLDLNKLNTSLKQSGMTLTDYGNKLARLGPTGDAAFLKIAQSIVETEMPLRRSGKLLQEFGTTLANTARWQISSSILHGFMGSVQKAYGYAQSLDKSLNNIRIVTGQNAEQMAIFAEKANKAAKALSTTTTDYTNASLIYYQQGLDDSEVQARTEVTVKMANAAGQSAEIVSDQLTAVWNNFYDGSKSLEYYADVMTALGAATASSTDEIAGGLEKFAAVGQTIGLSYEYAASALATITSNTRQSEEVVGTALKTIFARIQGLNLGETLEDGTTLNKYSEALNKVGISIFDSAGELKKMDNILDEMAGKWGTLSKAQQAALAQTVAGVRQYTQLIALMENWNNGDNDSMMANLDTAYGSTGALQEQADIYAESWEASKDRVQAALEGVYDSLLDKDFFTSVNDGFASMLGGVELLINSLGGMPGILSLIGVIGTRIFESQIANGINNALHSLKNFTGVSMLEMKQLKKEAYEYAMSMTSGMTDSPAVSAQRDHLKRVYELQIQTEEALKGVNQEQAEAIKKAYELAKGYSEVAVEAAKAQEAAEQTNWDTKKQESDIYGKGARKKISDSNDIAVGMAGSDLIREAKNVENIALDMGNTGTSLTELQEAIKNYRNVLKECPNDQKAVSDSAYALIQAMEGVEQSAQQQEKAFSAFQSVLDEASLDIVEVEFAYNELQASLLDQTPTEDQAQQIEKLTMQFKELGLPLPSLIGELKQYNNIINGGATEEEKAQALANLGKKFQETKVTSEAAQKATKKHAIELIKGTDNAKKYRKALTSMGDKLDKSVKSSREAAKAQTNHNKVVKEAENVQENYAAALAKAKGSVVSFGQGAAKTVQGISSMGMALSSLQGMWNTLTDPDTSGFEKLISVMTSSGMVVGSFTSGLAGLREGFSLMKGAADGTTSSLLAQAMQMKTSELQENSWIAKIREKNEARKAEKAAIIESAAANTAEAAATAAAGEAAEEYKEEKIEGAAATVASGVASGVDTAGKTAEAAATTAAGTAQSFLNTTLTPFIALMGAALVAALPFIAAAAALAAVIGAVAYAATEESRALKEAEEREQRAADTAKKVSEEINNINQSLNNIKSKTDTFKDLEQGTSEWYQTLNEVNAEITNLVEKFPELTKMGAIFRDANGMLHITQEGQDYIARENAKQQAVATNIELAAKRNTAQVNYDNHADNFTYKWDDGTTFRDKGTHSGTGTLSKEAQEQLMAGYAVYGDEMFTNEEYAAMVQKNVSEIDSNFSMLKGSTLEWLKGYEGIIKDQAERLDKIDAVTEQMISNRLSAYGSERSVEQAVELVGTDDWYTKTGEGNKRALNYTNEKGEEKAFDMNKHFNYTDEDMPQEIKDFMKLQGDNVEYVAQRNGKLVLEVDGEEVYYSEDEVYDAIGEMYAVDKMESKIRENLTAAYGNALSGLNDLDTDNLIQLDNFYLGLEEVFGEGQEAQVNAAFTKIVNAYGTGKEQLEQLAEDTTYIDKQSAAFQRLVTNAQLTGEQLKLEMQKLNAVGQLDSMGSFFSDAATSMGLSEAEAGEMQEYAKSLMEVAESSDELDSGLATNAEGAADLAIEITRMNKGIDALADGFDDWSSILKKSSKTSAEYSKAMSGMKGALSDVLDVESDLISNDFVTDHMDDIAKAATGDADAIDKLRAAMDEEIIANISMGQTEEFKAKLIELDQNLKDLVPEDVEIGMVLTGADETEKAFLDAANKIVEDAGMSADEANAYFAGIGYEPVYNTTDVEDATSMDLPSGSNTISLDHIGWSDVPIDLPDWLPGDHTLTLPNITYSTKPVTKEPEKSGADMRLTSFSGEEKPPKIEGLRKKATGAQNNYSSSNKGGKSPGSGGNKGGGGSKKQPQKAKKKDRSEIVDRYKEIEESIDDISKASDKASKAADRMYGAGRIAQMAKVNSLLLKETELLKKKKKEAEAYLKIDKAKLDQSAKEAGVILKYDAEGRIINYTEELNKLADELDALVDEINADGDESEEEKEKREALEEKIENLKKDVDQYNETRNVIEDIDTEIEDKFYEWQDNNFEMWSHSLEVTIDINDDALEMLDYYLGKTEGDFFKQAEGLAIMNGQLAMTNASMGTYIGHLGSLGAMRATGAIDQADFVEGLDQVHDGIMQNLQALQDLDKQMLEYYGNALSLAREEIDKYTNQLEHNTSVLEHYLSLMELMGHATDYRQTGKILAGQVATTRAEMDAAKAEYEYLAEEAEKKKAKMDRALLSTTAEVYKKEYEAALEASMEVQDEYLSKAEAYAEALNAVLENSLNQFGQDLENALTGGTSFDQMTAKMERMVSLEEEYLTATNKVYETNKLMNQAQQEIDKTTNTVAKNKLKQFITETNHLQEKNQLSKFELDVQKAKYELLLAEIALEEAQASKAKVRLKRDAEGNFGYVYTADAESVAKAEEDFADKQNELYNIALEGINTYAEKYQQTLQEMYDTLTEIDQQYREGAFESDEEYKAARLAAEEYYFKKLEQFSDIYNTALQVDIRATEDAWGSEYESMINSTAEWEEKVIEHGDKVQTELIQWKNEMTSLANETGISFNKLSSSVDRVTASSNNLVDELTKSGGLMDQIEDEMNKVSALTSLYASLRWAVLAAAAAYEVLAMAIMTAKAAEAVGGAMVGIAEGIDWQGVGGAISGAAEKLGNKASSSKSSNSSSGSSGFNIGDKVVYTGGTYYATSSGTGSTGNRGSGGTVTITQINEGASNPIHVSSSNSAYGWLTEDQLKHFDTGGYTGSWGSYGKLAVLDEKELVLNADDTKNFLASMELLNSIISTIDLHAANQSLGGGMLNSPGLSNISGDTLEQSVTIEANFPNVSSRTEIEEAFSTLVNRASQYANRK